MIRRLGVFVALVCLVSSSSAVFAQGQRGQQRGQRPGGGFGGGGVTALLAIPEVQKELAVSADQKGLIEDLVKDLGGGAGGGGAGGNRQDFQNLSQEERQKRIEELRKQGEERAKKAEDLVKTILDAKQFERLSQLRLQREGGSALARAEVAASLNLTSEQKDKVAKIRDASRPGQGGAAGGGGNRNASQEERQKAAAEARDRREKTNADYLAVLTSEQKSKWETMLGKKFDFPAPQARRGGAN